MVALLPTPDLFKAQILAAQNEVPVSQQKGCVMCTLVSLSVKGSSKRYGLRRVKEQ